MNFVVAQGQKVRLTIAAGVAGPAARMPRRSIAGMVLHVLLQQVLIDKALCAVRTDKGTDVRVIEQVLFQGRLSIEGLSTRRTEKVLFIGVRQHVSAHLVLLGKEFAALKARELLFASMGQHVFFQVARLPKRPTTDGTNVPPTAAVDLSVPQQY